MCGHQRMFLTRTALKNFDYTQLFMLWKKRKASLKGKCRLTDRYGYPSTSWATCNHQVSKALHSEDTFHKLLRERPGRPHPIGHNHVRGELAGEDPQSKHGVHVGCRRGGEDREAARRASAVQRHPRRVRLHVGKPNVPWKVQGRH